MTASLIPARMLRKIYALAGFASICYSPAPIHFWVIPCPQLIIGQSMSHLPRKTAGLLFAGLFLVASGCSTMKMPEFPKFSNIWPESLGGQPDKSELNAQYGPPPSERLEKLADLEEDSARYAPGDQQRASDTLAQQIQQEKDPVVRRQIVRSMTNLRTPAADYILRAGLHGDKDTSVRVECAEVLGRRGGQEAVRELLTVVQHDKNIDVRIAAMRAIGEIGDPAVAPALAIGLEPKEDPALQYRTAQVLTKLTGQSYGNDLVAWRSYVSTGIAPPRNEPSLAERAQSLYWWR